jgi:hypothetical protein
MRAFDQVAAGRAGIVPKVTNRVAFVRRSSKKEPARPAITIRPLPLITASGQGEEQRLGYHVTC